MRVPSHARNLLMVARDGLLFGLPLLPWVIIVGIYRNGSGAFDLHVFWVAAHSIAHGISPYDPTAVAHDRALVLAHSKSTLSAAWAVYPPALYAALVPFGLLPWHVAAPVGIAGIAAAAFLALRVMGVRDWRCYAVAAGSVPFAMTIVEGSISTCLMLATALAWRGRAPIVSTAAALVAKLFVWPAVFVVAALYGYRRAALLLIGSLAAVLGSWAIIGFDSMMQYPKMLSDLSAAEGLDSFSSAGLVHALGGAPRIGEYAGELLGLALAILAFLLARRGQRDAAFTLAILAALLASPIVWTHYFVLLYLPLAAHAKRFSMLWLVPLPMWLGHPLAAKGHLSAFLATWPCIAIILFVALRAMLAPRPVGRSLQLASPPGAKAVAATHSPL